MKVTMLRNPARQLGCPLTEGQTGEVPEKLGKQLVESGLAVCLEIKAVPAKPAIAEAAAVEISAEAKPKRVEPAKAESKTSK